MAIERIATDETVFEIADQLTANGEKVTNRAIWTAIGGGSMTTISQCLRHWRERQEIQVTQPIERTPLPAALVDVLHHAAAQLWDAALAETKSELEQLAQATNARIAEAHAERDETLTELQATAEELEQVKAERDAAQAEINNQAQQLATSAAELAKLRAELNTQALATTQAAHRAETAEAVITELHDLLKAEQEGRKAEATELREALTAQISATTHAAYRAETAETAQVQLNKSLKTEQSERKAETTTLRAAMESIQAEKSKLEGMLLVFESIGGSSAQAETTKAPAKTPRKPKQAK
jgi:chromosome segregation ATPase